MHNTEEPPTEDETENSEKNYNESKPVDTTKSTAYIDKKAIQIMAKMGYQSGLGLGKNKQGIVNPLLFSANPGKCGLGLEMKPIAFTDTAEHQFDEISVEETIEWLEASSIDSDHCFTDDSISSKFIIKRRRKINLDDETNFCDSEIIHNLFKAKGIFEELNLSDLNKARLRANTFEKVRSVFFMNRAALKMANIDAATNFMFTSIDDDPKHQRTSGPYYFADVCAGPGGFSEYVLWRKKWLFKGFGFTLKEENDFKLYTSCCACPITFQPFYGVLNDGNICNPANIADFKEKVLHETQGKGVHFMMSDGGFSVEGNENLQEVLSKQIYVCQCLVALEIVRTHGHFVTKLFDIFTLFSAGLLFLMSKCFEKVCILKPNASRPANSERYFVCYGLKDSKITSKIKQYIKKIVEELWYLKDSDTDITEIVPLYVIEKDKQFLQYLKNSNERIGNRQIKALYKLQHFCKHPLLYDPRQVEIRAKCLEYWKIPDNPKIIPTHTTPDEILLNFVKNPEYLLVKAKQVSKLCDLHILSDINDWHFCFLSSDSEYDACHLYIGSGNSKTYKLQTNKYSRVKNLKLIPGTVLFAEFVRERIEPSNSLTETERYSLHVIDALRLGEFSLANLPFNERLRLINTYCESINHESRSKCIRIRSKPMRPLFDFSSKLLRISEDKVLAEDLNTIGFRIRRESYDVSSILLVKSDESQSFRTTYVLRTQLTLTQEGNQANECAIALEDFCNYVDTLKLNYIGEM